MKNKEKYKQAFSAIRISDKFSLEVKKMTIISKRRNIHRVIAGIVACIFLIGIPTFAYASDLAGIQRTIQLWIYGDQTKATITFDGSGSYDMKYTDNEGKEVHSGGGGVAINNDGSERPLTEDELTELLNNPEVIYEDDGSVWVYYFDQKIDITDKFEDNLCYVKVSNGKETLYLTIQYQNGWSSNPHKYPTPSR